MERNVHPSRAPAITIYTTRKVKDDVADICLSCADRCVEEPVEEEVLHAYAGAHLPQLSGDFRAQKSDSMTFAARQYPCYWLENNI